MRFFFIGRWMVDGSRRGNDGGEAGKWVQRGRCREEEGNLGVMSDGRREVGGWHLSFAKGQ